MFKKSLSLVLAVMVMFSLIGCSQPAPTVSYDSNEVSNGSNQVKNVKANKASNYSDADFKDCCYCYFDGNEVLHFTSNSNKSGTYIYGYGKDNIGGPYILEEQRGVPNNDLNSKILKVTEVTFDNKIVFDGMNHIDGRDYDSQGFFNGFKNLKKINNIENLVINNMNHMFSYCYSLETLDLSGMDVSHVKTMCAAFCSCENLKSLNVSTWNTCKVKDMTAMFDSCEKLTSLDLRNFDTSNVESMSSMFRYCPELIVLNTTNWDVSNVRDIRQMFNCCSEFKDDCSIDVSNLKFPREVRYDNITFQNSSVKANWWDKRESKMKNN